MCTALLEIPRGVAGTDLVVAFKLSKRLGGEPRREVDS
jgi:hypothetical protein